MQGRIALSFALSWVLIVSGCSYLTNVNLYPVQGPASALAPPVVYTLTIHGNSKGSSISVTLANGETFQGGWKDFVESSANKRTAGTADSYPPQPNLAFAWDAIYGQGFFVAHLLGKSVLQATMTGSQGTILEAELMGQQGVAIDSKGNIYKMTW